MFNFDMEVESPIETMRIIKGDLPKENTGSDIVLISNRNKEELEEFIKKESGYVFVFTNEDSMEKGKQLFLGSKDYLDDGFNMHELLSYYASKEDEIRILDYISGIDKFKDKGWTLIFIKDEATKNNLQDMGEGFHVCILKDKKIDSAIEGFYIVE